MHRRRAFLGGIGAVASLLAGCSSGSQETPSGGAPVVSTSHVSMIGRQFDPRNIKVASGATVTWTNQDEEAHTVTNASDNWSFDTEVTLGDSAAFTFDEADVYDVYCRFHGAADLSGMSMKIAVGDATIQAPLGAPNQPSTAPM